MWSLDKANFNSPHVVHEPFHSIELEICSKFFVSMVDRRRDVRCSLVFVLDVFSKGKLYHRLDGLISLTHVETSDSFVSFQGFSGRLACWWIDLSSIGTSTSKWFEREFDMFEGKVKDSLTASLERQFMSRHDQGRYTISIGLFPNNLKMSKAAVRASFVVFAVWSWAYRG
jgi:hypothetical protein